ncbi:MAG: hypothetical protein WCY62_08415 [Clostridia bacterium]
MVEKLPLIFIIISTALFISVPSIPFVILFIKKGHRTLLLGCLCFLIFGIILTNLFIYLLFLIPGFEAFLKKSDAVYAISISLVTCAIHMIVRTYIVRREHNIDALEFAAGETLLQCIYIGIPTIVLDLIYSLMINWGGVQYIGVTESIRPVVDALVNEPYTEYLTDCMYPIWILSVNFASMYFHLREKGNISYAESLFIEFISLTVYTYLSIKNMDILNVSTMAIPVVFALFIYIAMNKKKHWHVHITDISDN